MGVGMGMGISVDIGGGEGGMEPEKARAGGWVAKGGAPGHSLSHAMPAFWHYNMAALHFETSPQCTRNGVMRMCVMHMCTGARNEGGG